jgi:hypothetical protein
MSNITSIINFNHSLSQLTYSTNPKKKNNNRTHPSGYLVLRTYLPYIGGSHRRCCPRETRGTFGPKKKKEKRKT